MSTYSPKEAFIDYMEAGKDWLKLIK